MIFVTVGTHTAPFDRLIRWMDEIAERLDEPVVQQTGSARYLPSHSKYFRFCTSGEMREWLRKAHVVVTHGGSSIREVILMERPAIVVPRLKKHGEVIDDHQLDLAQALAQRGMIMLALDAQSLETALRAPPPQVVALPSPEPLIRALSERINRLGS